MSASDPSFAKPLTSRAQRDNWLYAQGRPRRTLPTHPLKRYSHGPTISYKRTRPIWRSAAADLKLTDSRRCEPRTSVRAVFQAGGGVIFVRCSVRAKARGSMELRMFRLTESVSLSSYQRAPSLLIGRRVPHPRAARAGDGPNRRLTVPRYRGNGTGRSAVYR